MTKNTVRSVSKNNIGNAWEYYIASVLSANDFIATITLGRAETYDIIAVSENWKWKVVKISVKTRLQKDNKFALWEKDENWWDKDWYYAFVMFNDLKTEPDFWIIPSQVVNKITKDSYQKRKEWKLSRNDTKFRNLHLKLVDWYPKDWEEQLKIYYKNVGQLKYFFI